MSTGFGFEQTPIEVPAYVAALEALQFPALVTETALGLIEGWMQRFAATDSAQTTLLVETPFVVEIDPHALLIGIADRIAWSPEAESVFGCSWKTTREAKGQYWNEKIWLAEQRRSPQWRFETLALKRGAWVTPEGLRRFKLTGTPPFLLRGAVKSAMPEFWPERAEDGIFEMTPAEERALVAALAARVAAVRAFRKLGESGLPWQLPGTHCIQYNRRCDFLAACERGDVNVPKYEGPPNEHDRIIDGAIERVRPGFGAHPDDIVLTPTNYMLGSGCIEHWRRRRLFPTESTDAQRVGSAFHAGAAAWYEHDLPIAKGDELNTWLTTP